MNQSPCKDDFLKLIAACDDSRGDHRVWVGHDGEVHISCLADEKPSTDAMKFRYETLLQGNGYVGPAAARDEGWMRDLWENGIVRDWVGGASGYIDA